jgi:hypothetical protein
MKTTLLVGVTLAVLATAGAAMAGGDNRPAANAPGNLVVNGDLSAGFSGFSTDYTTADQFASGYSQYPETQVEIARNSADTRPDGAWGAFVGPEEGQNFLMINGATTYLSGTTLRNFWDEIVHLAPNTTYKLAFDVANAYPVSPPTVVLTLNGQTVAGQSVFAGGGQGDWATEVFTFNSGAGGDTTVGLADSNLEASGNDFAATNFSLGAAVPEPATWSMMILGAAMIGFAARRRREGMAVAA